MIPHFLPPLLEKADIVLNGSRPWDIQVHDDRLYARIIRQGNLGFGEAYMEGWWDCEQIDVMICKILRHKLHKRFERNIPVLLTSALYTLRNLQSVSRASMVAEQHYNFGNDMFEAMLGPNMNYSCGYWRRADTLEQAQHDKMEMICRKLQLAPDMHVLDIGCGWGALAGYMARHYGVRVTAVTVSDEQLTYARAHTGNLPVTWLLRDYRSLNGRFDRIVSVGMFEHVGHKNYVAFMNTVRRLLTDTGLFLLHTIGSNEKKRGVDPWIAKYIFKNGMLPSPSTITDVLYTRFVMEDWHNFGADYDKTLMAWAANFEKGLEEGRFACSEMVRRMFRYYLLSCAGAFRARDLQLWQLVLSRDGVPGGYCCDR